MISRRQHTISMVAVFLALAVGVVLGSQVLGVGMLSGLRGERVDLRQRADELTTRNAQLTDQLAAAYGFLGQSTGRILSGTLADRSVLVFTTPDADVADVHAVIETLTAAGASLAGRIALTSAFVDATEGDRLRTAVTNVIPAGVQLPTGAVDHGSLAGDLLGAALLTDPAIGQPRGTEEERELVLETLRGGGFLTAVEVRPAQLAVVVTGDGMEAEENSRGSIIARFAGGLRGRGAGVVLAGRASAAEGVGPIAVVRSDIALAAAVTTVDNVDREIGRITTALGLVEQLNGGVGRYGTGAEATSLTVAVTSP